MAVSLRFFTVFAGQSNIGYCRIEDAPAAGGATLDKTEIWMNGEGRFDLLRLGLNTVQRPMSPISRTNYGPEWSFAREFRLALTGHTHYVLKYFRGGSSLFHPDEWNPDSIESFYFQGLKAEVAAAVDAEPSLRGQLRCLIWGHGESDVGRKAVDVYPRLLLIIADAIRDISGSPKMMVLWPLLSYRANSNEIRRQHTDRFRAMQARTALKDRRVRLFSMDDQPKLDAVHYAPAAIELYGERAFQVFATSPAGKRWIASEIRKQATSEALRAARAGARKVAKAEARLVAKATALKAGRPIDPASNLRLTVGGLARQAARSEARSAARSVAKLKRRPKQKSLIKRIIGLFNRKRD